MAKAESKIKEGAAPFLEAGEEVLAALVARPRGWTQSSAGAAGPGMIAADLGRNKLHKNVEASKASGFEITSPMALAVTSQRLICFKISSPVGLGIGGSVKELFSAVPIGDVDGIESKRLAVGHTLTVTVRGTPFVLEVGAGGNVKGVVEAFAAAKG